MNDNISLYARREAQIHVYILASPPDARRAAHDLGPLFGHRNLISCVIM